MISPAKRFYYTLKPMIPRSVQIALRRKMISMKRPLHNEVWPINESAAQTPENWSGWPEKKKFALVLMHDVETEKGHGRCRPLMQLEEESGFRSSFNFVPERYQVSPELRRELTRSGFEIGVHGLKHDGKLFLSKEKFDQQADRINRYLREWDSVGFVSPSMHRNLDWMHALNIEYDVSTFDTDPFEPQPDGIGTIFPFAVREGSGHGEYIELPYTLPQDFSLFVLMEEKNIDIWKKKLDWIVEKGGMALLISHPDYMNAERGRCGIEEYPMAFYKEFLEYLKDRYAGQYWNALPKEVAHFWRENRKDLPEKSNAITRPAPKPAESPIKKNGKLRACMVAYAFYESDNRVRRYAETLVRRGYEVDAVALRREDQPEYENLKGVHLFRIQKRVRDEKGKASYLYRLLKFFVHSAFFISKQHLQRRYDLIHVHSVPDFEVFATCLAKMTGARIILDIHDIVPEFYASKFNVSKASLAFKALALIEKASTAFSDHVIIANHIWEKTLVFRSVKKDKCTTLLNYPDQSIFYRRGQTKTNGQFVMVYPGTLNWHQGVDIAVRAVALIKDDVPEAELHIYGDGPIRDAIGRLISDLGLQDRVFLKGTLPSEQIAAVMADADLGVVPKRNDAFGGDAFSTKIFEFMALGVPVVVAATRIDRYYFNDSLVRFFESEDVKDLARAMEELARNEELRKRLAENASAFVVGYTWDKKEGEYLSLVNRLVGKR